MLNSTMKETLLQSRPFHYLNSAELDTLLIYCKFITFEPEEVILKQGNKNDKMYIIIEGEAIALAKILGKGMVPLSTLNNGDFMGEVSLIEKDLCASTVIANTKLNCLLITRDYFNTLAFVFPEIKHKITRAIIENLSDRLRKMFDLIKGHVEKSIVTSWHSFNEALRSLMKSKSISLGDINLNREEIHHLELFSSFNSNELDELLTYARVISITTKDTLIYKDYQDTTVYIVLHGAVEAAINKSDTRIKLSVLGPGNLFGGTSYCTGLDTEINYSTRERTVLLEFKSSQLELLQKNNIHIWYQFYDLICHSLVEMERAVDKLYIRLNSEISISE